MRRKARNTKDSDTKQPTVHTTAPIPSTSRSSAIPLNLPVSQCLATPSPTQTPVTQPSSYGLPPDLAPANHEDPPSWGTGWGLSFPQQVPAETQFSYLNSYSTVDAGYDFTCATRGTGSQFQFIDTEQGPFGYPSDANINFSDDFPAPASTLSSQLCSQSFGYEVGMPQEHNWSEPNGSNQSDSLSSFNELSYNINSNTSNAVGYGFPEKTSYIPHESGYFIPRYH